MTFSTNLVWEMIFLLLVKYNIFGTGVHLWSFADAVTSDRSELPVCFFFMSGKVANSLDPAVGCC